MQIRNYRTSILLAVSFSITLSFFWLIPQFAFVVFISLLVNLLLRPLADRLSRRIPRPFAAGALLLLLIACLSTTLILVSQSFLPSFSQFVEDFPKITEKIRASLLLHGDYLPVDAVESFLQQVRNTSLDALASSLTMIVDFFGKILDLIMILFITFYLLKDGEKIKSFVASLFPTKDFNRVRTLFERILQGLRIYIFGQLVICVITAIIVFCYFTLRGLPYASVFAVISGIAEFIPVLGPTVASTLGIILTTMDSPFLAFQTLAFYLILTQVNHNIIVPYLIGKSLNLHPIAIILGLIFGGEVMGIAGMFLAVPFIVICKLVIEDIYQDRLETIERLNKSRWLDSKRTDPSK